MKLGFHLVTAVEGHHQGMWRMGMRRLRVAVFILGMLSLGTVMAWSQDSASRVATNARPPWTDPATRLMWAPEDNGGDVTWNQAGDYCSNLRLAGNSDWRLATIDELSGIYDRTRNVNGCWVKGNIKLSANNIWSKNAGAATGEAWLFLFGGAGGGRFSYAFEGSGGSRALCVRLATTSQTPTQSVAETVDFAGKWEIQEGSKGHSNCGSIKITRQNANQYGVDYGWCSDEREAGTLLLANGQLNGTVIDNMMKSRAKCQISFLDDKQSISVKTIWGNQKPSIDFYKKVKKFSWE